MNEALVLENLMTLAGLVAFIEILLQLVLKPALKPYLQTDWYGLAINGLSFLCGFLGCLLACLALNTCGYPRLAQCLITALQATGIATVGFETIKHVMRLATKGRRFSQ